MKIKTTLSLLASLLLIAADARADGLDYAQYGHDSREDVFAIQSRGERELADSTVALIRNSKLHHQGNVVQLVTQNYGREENLCDEERFTEQGEAAFCSGAFIGNDLVLTAGHCVHDQAECDHVSALFGFALHYAGEVPSHFSPSEIYACAEVVERQQARGVDFEILRLGRVVQNHRALEVETESKLVQHDPLFTIGYPMGIPAKLAHGKVVSSRNSHSFGATLDTYAGNSGSPVFNETTYRIEGVLVQGRNDFKKDSLRGCKISALYDENESSAETVTKIAEVLPWLK